MDYQLIKGQIKGHLSGKNIEINSHFRVRIIVNHKREEGNVN